MTLDIAKKMHREKVNITINSAVLYVAAFLVTTMIHELGHALSGMFFGSDPVLHHNYVEHLSPENITRTQNVVTALAGPILSLLQGVLAGTAYLRAKNHKLTTLFLLWFSILGLNNFLGYMMTGFLFQQGDIGKVFLILEVPLFTQIGIAVLAALALLFMAYKLTSPFLKFSYRTQWVDSEQSRVNFSFHILILPWIIGSVAVTIAYLPIQAVVSIIYPIMSGFVFIFPWQNARRIQTVTLSGSDKLGEISKTAIGILIVLMLFFKLVLAKGISL